MPKISIVPYRVADQSDTAGLALAKSGELFLASNTGRTLYKKNSDGSLLEGLLEETKSRPAVKPALVANFVNAKYLNAMFDYSRSSTGTYFSKQGNLVTAAIGEPRFEYDPATRMSEGLLLESSAINFLCNSDSLIGPQWSLSNCTEIANATVSPTGDINATKIVESADATAVWHQLGQSYNITSLPTSQVYMTSSVFAKAGERSTLLLQITGGVNSQTSGVRAIFDLANGTVSTPFQYSEVTTTMTKATITLCSNGWYRCVVSAMLPDGSNRFNWTVMPTKSTSYPDGLNYVGDGVSGLYLFGAQAEYSTGPTSYISAGDSPVSRSADYLVLKDGKAGAILGGEMTFFVEFDQNFSESEWGRIVSVTENDTSDSWHNEWCLMYNQTAQMLYVGGQTNGVALNNSAGVPIAANIIQRACFGYSKTASCGSINGSNPFTNDGLSLNATILRLGNRPGGDEELSCHIRHFVIYPSLLAASEMKALSTL
jgi:hypothetical protein